MPLGTRALRAVALLAGVAAAATMTACADPVSESPSGPASAPASSAAGGSPASTGVNQEARALLPEEFLNGEPIKVGTEAFYPPYDYLAEDGQTIIGLDVDLFDEVAKALGVEYTLENAAFDSLLPGIDTGRYDVIVAALTDNANRQANYDMVDYFLTGQSIVVAAGNPEGVKGEADLCGKAVSVLTASAQETILQEFNADLCADSPIDILPQATDDDAYMQLQTGRVAATLSQDPVARDRVAKVGGGSELELANAEPFQTKPLGYALAKDSTQLRDALQVALQGLLDDGTYATVLEKHGLGASAIGEITVNAGE
ncbi:MAG: ABC transporter substrate-binding protein [Bifidobacteriaceae bacterium]|jgi:polar amino acid transport system substrate-binding protein|nr:ABC transporter substrate-binding protein [Bifidobacteriaceae bacterium]